MRNIVIILLLVSSCTYRSNRPNDYYGSFESTDTSLHFVNGYCYHTSYLLSGVISERYQNNRLQNVTNYINGKEEGWKYSYYPDSTLAEKRYYHIGEKDSVHTGWWPNGKLRFEYHFSNGLYNGDFKEWYVSGAKYKHIHYINGAEYWAKGWRENGKVYMNFIVKKGRRYGIENSNLCYTVKKGNELF